MPPDRFCRRPRSPASGRRAPVLPVLLVLPALLLLLVPIPRLDAQLPGEPGGAATPMPAAVAGRSLLLPGWGQHALGQRRSWAYLAVEATLWAYWANRRSAGADARDAYRDLAWGEARIGSASRVDGDWPYYETLEKWTRSGVYDADPARSGVQPEADPSTYNGYVWSLARGQFLQAGEPDESDPGYAQALAYYERRAYGAAFLWDWSGKDTALRRYEGLIRDSDDRFHQATTALGAVLANHLLSAADAFVSARLPGDAGLRIAPGTAAGRSGWTLALRLRPTG